MFRATLLLARCGDVNDYDAAIFNRSRRNWPNHAIHESASDPGMGRHLRDLSGVVAISHDRQT